MKPETIVILTIFAGFALLEILLPTFSTKADKSSPMLL